VERDDRVRSLLMKRSAGKSRDEAAGSGNEGAHPVEKIRFRSARIRSR
jgi:hypothetical protein